MHIKPALEQMASGESPADPHRNLAQYLSLVPDPQAELDELTHLLGEFVHTKIPADAQRALSSPTTSASDRLRILTRYGLKVPFDYFGNAQKTAALMQEQGDRFLTLKDATNGTGFHFLRTPVELLRGHLTEGTGGDCFSTSLWMQLLYAAHGIESRLGLSYDRPEHATQPERKHHCVTLARTDGIDHYTDTSLNVEVPIPFGERPQDSGRDSQIFRLVLDPHGDLTRVRYRQRASPAQGILKYAKMVARDLLKGPVPLWYFESAGTPLSAVLPSMLYTLHPEVPPSTGNQFNRNQQLRLNALTADSAGRLHRGRVFLNERRAGYYARTITDQVEADERRLDVSHDSATGQMIGNLDKLAQYVATTFGIHPGETMRTIQALDYLNGHARRGAHRG